MQKITWGMACDKLVFVADFDDKALGAVDVDARCEGHPGYLSRDKWSCGWLHIVAQYIDDYDWFFKADDDTVVLVDNFRRYVVETADRHAVHEPRYVGLRQLQSNISRRQFNLGAGYALNRPAMRLVNCMLTTNISISAPTTGNLERCEIVPANRVRGVDSIWAQVQPSRFRHVGCVKGFVDPYDCTCNFWKRQRNEDMNMAVCLRGLEPSIVERSNSRLLDQTALLNGTFRLRTGI